MEALGLDFIQHGRGAGMRPAFKAEVDDFAQLLLSNQLVDLVFQLVVRMLRSMYPRSREWPD